MIYGASGSIGTAAVQLAKSFGAHVTAVCDTERLELVRSLGADEVIDYTRDDFTKNGETYDVVFDSVGKHSFRRCRGSLKAGGVFLETDLGFMWHVPPLALLTRWIGDKKVTLPIPKYTEGRRPLRQGAPRDGQVPRRHRPEVPARGGRRGDEVRRDGQKTGNVVLTVGAAMRAVVHDRYGPPEVLHVEEVERPVPGPTRSSSAPRHHALGRSFRVIRRWAVG